MSIVLCLIITLIGSGVVLSFFDRSVIRKFVVFKGGGAHYYGNRYLIIFLAVKR